MSDFHSESTARLYQAISLIQSAEECKAFLDDLCTIKEVQDMAQRFDTAIMLSKGENYQAIARQVGVSTATISRVNRCLSYGEGGYRTIIDRLNGAEHEE